MTMPIEEEIIYNKSWLKLIVVFIVLSLSTITFFFMGFSDEVSWSWIAWIIAATIGQYLYMHCKAIFSDYSLKINRTGIEFCGNVYEWSRINSFSETLISYSDVRISSIHISYDDETIKPLFYFLTKKLRSPELIIHQYKLNASQDVIYETLKNYHQKILADRISGTFLL